ncbi:MAG TPA: hypothetical protein VGX21_01370 [Methylomirabilota bacterium]|jgi:hypothetical protein|nr:hypothetical protein [Methylomirabilota bacterium]
MTALRALLVALLLGLVASWPGGAEGADPTGLQARLTEEVLNLTLPVTPGQVRDLVALLETPDRVALDLADATGAVLEALHRLPGAVVHDVVYAGPNLAFLLEALVADGRALASIRDAEHPGLFRHTLRALHRSAVFSARAALLRRLTHPDNTTVRLAIVVTVRGQGVPLETSDLDVVRRSILDPESADLAPALAHALNRVIRLYGREAVRILLTR